MHSNQTATNISNYQNPRIDKLLEDGRAELTLVERSKIYLDFQRFLLEDSKGECNSFLKGFITSIEKSNEGFIFNFDEATLKGKKFGGVFAREQYRNASGESKMSTKLRFIRSTEGIHDVEVPGDKLLPASEIQGFYPINNVTEEDNSDLPF